MYSIYTLESPSSKFWVLLTTDPHAETREQAEELAELASRARQKFGFHAVAVLRNRKDPVIPYVTWEKAKRDKQREYHI